MKKTLVALFLFALLALSLSVAAFDLNLKKKGCEAACDTTYEECMAKAQKELGQEKDSTKKKAADLACSVAKDECYKKCSK